MKKTMLLFIVLVLAFSGNAFAGDIGYGAKAGLNMAKFTGEDASYGDTDPKFKLGTTIGGFATIPLGEKFTVRPELMFTQKGAKYKESEDGLEVTATTKMNWLDIPILGVYQVAEAISAFIGPYFELYLGGEEEWKFEGDGVSIEGDEKIEGEDINSLGFGLIFGGAYGVTDNIDVEARIELGLTSKDPDHTVKNMGIQVLANYYIKK